MQTLQSYIKKSEAFKAFASNRKGNILVEGLDGFPLFQCAHMMASQVMGVTWMICPTEEIARQLFTNCSMVDCRAESGSGVPVMMLPASGRVLYSPWEGTTKDYEQLRCLGSIATASRVLVITSIRAICSPIPRKNAIDASSIVFKVGQSLDTMGIATKLAAGNYFRSANTTMPGEFTIRGEVVDIFPYGADLPIRIYLDWDQIEKICRYEPLTQQVTKQLGHVALQILPSQDGTDVIPAGIKDYFTDDDYFIFLGDKRLESSFKSMQMEAKSLFRRAFQENRDATKPSDILFDYLDFYEKRKSSMTVLDISGQTSGAYRFDIDGPRSYFGNFTFFKEDLTGLTDDGWDVNICVTTEVQKQRLCTMLSDFPSINYMVCNISGGFALRTSRFIVFCENEIFGRKKQVIKTLQHTQTSALDSFVELHEGDYVVHVNYGIGIFLKIDRVRERDYIKIQFADKENLYVPIEQANLIQRYIGSAGEAPRIDKLGSQGWENKKSKARKSAEDLASHLIQLYARRRNSQGFAFEKDNDWQLKFEAEFEYDETEDQLTCIQDIKDDMESPSVMDRLVCGDVGYGKTEIAFRAAFKAVMSGKQVAFLAPTTILAEQHYNNFKNRLNEFPLKVGLLSRMVGTKEQKKTLKLLESGQLDVLFGTQKIIQKNVVFKDLGLLIVDEEQRFGVKDKERIKDLKANIDCLALSATPIPRTLYMSLLKIRDMSLLTTPPISRKPIQTVIQRYDLDEVERAIRFEVNRHGQVFYLHNRIESLEEVASILRSRMPDIIIDTANGQMRPEALEDTMRRFVYEGVQVLVSTTIIENGIDIPNVNTIIIDRADLYGVSQLYQLRGRVGRSDKEAYAYLLYPSDRTLSEIAIKRLQTISEHTELGGGFKVAMKDMELRGAGNLLGREQSGFMSAVGLDMYIRLLDEEIAKLQNDGQKPETEVFLELDYSGFIPDSYISDPTIKLEIYKKIAGTKNSGQLERLSAELKDRFGSIPEEVANLLYICELRIVCRALDIYHMKERQGNVTVEFSKLSSVDPGKAIDLIRTSRGAVTIDPRRPNMMNMKTNAISLKDKALFILEKLQRILP
ncbi:MAG: transcription-repair coupling factor [Sphaerochaetaceae bacterium]|nr:transcription-repair coupling factor [Sphaerochaetaceae bacterium]